MLFLLVAAGCRTDVNAVHCTPLGALVEVEKGSLKRIDRECGETVTTHPVTGRVLGRSGALLTVHHDAIDGFMPEMTMDLNLPVDEPVPVEAGDAMTARLLQHGGRLWLVDIEKTGVAAPVEARTDVPVVKVGEVWPPFEGTTGSGEPFELGGPAVLAFLYTRCPNPEFCPALVARLLALQEQLPDGARILTVTLDPENDTPDVLGEYGSSVGADPGKWTFIQTDADTVERLALQAGQTVTREPGGIRHAHRLVVLDARGAVLERYDHNLWPLDRVVSQLADGRPIGLFP